MSNTDLIGGIQYTFYLTAPITIPFRDIIYKNLLC